jgi:hypothetical protein
LLPDPALGAPVNVGQATATLADKDADRIQGKTPARLDEALKYAVARIENDPRNVETIVSRAIESLREEGSFRTPLNAPSL